MDEPLELCAELEHGTLLRGAGAIRARRSGVPIKRIFLVREGEDADAVLREQEGFFRYVDVPVRAETLYAIREADVIVFGPGSLYLSLLPDLLLQELREAVQASRARKVLIASLMTEPGQTDHFGVADYVRAVHAYGGLRLDHVLVNSGTRDRQIEERYSAALASPVLPDDGAGKDGQVVSAGHRLRRLSTAEGAILVGRGSGDEDGGAGAGAPRAGRQRLGDAEHRGLPARPAAPGSCPGDAAGGHRSGVGN